MAGLDEFHPMSDLPPDFMMIMYGMRRSGKTTALLHMLDSMQQRFETHKTFIFASTGKVNPIQWKNFPMTSINTDIDKLNKNIGDIIEEQEYAIDEEVRRQAAEKRLKPVPVPKRDDKKPVNNDLDGLKPNVKKKGEKANKLRKGKRKRENVGTIPLEGDPGPDNDLERFPGEVQTTSDNHNRQLTKNDILKIRRSGEIDEKTMPHILIIMDDVIHENSIRHAPNLNRLASTGRHIFITCIILSQCVCGSQSVPPGIRINSDYVMVCANPSNKNERDMLQVNYLTISNDRGQMDKGLNMLAAVTSVEYRELVIKVNHSTAKEFKDYLFTYGPVPEAPKNVSANFRLGTDKQWEDDDKLDRKPAYTSTDFLRDPPKGPSLQAIDSGRFSVGNRSGVPGDVHVSKGIERFVSRHSEFLDPYF